MDFEADIRDDRREADPLPCEGAYAGFEGEKSSITVTADVIKVTQIQIPFMGSLGLDWEAKTETVVSKEVTFSYQCCCKPEGGSGSDESQ